MSIIYKAEKVPVLQNKVFSKKEEALNCRTGSLDIVYDSVKDFACNESFNSNFIEYDWTYNNSVPSKKFLSYYDEIIDYLESIYNTEGLIVDVGCGKGTFLKRWQERNSEIKGVGIDPSYEGVSQIGKVKFIKEYFNGSQLSEKPALIICRHTLEHIPEPHIFLGEVTENLLEGVPVFCEVPDLNWIVKNKAWWDFCYEHVNYFTSYSFQNCLLNANLGEVTITSAFSEQYLWGEGIVGGRKIITEKKSQVVPLKYEQISLPLDRAIVIWGMATKGVMLSLRIKNAEKFIDINKSKQGKFTPLSGALIESPENLKSGKEYTIIVMNSNYLHEIKEECKSLLIDAVFFDAIGNQL